MDARNDDFGQLFVAGRFFFSTRRRDFVCPRDETGKFEISFVSHALILDVIIFWYFANEL